MREERSAGVVIWRLSNDVSQQKLFLLLDYGRHWDFPKGHVEPGESDQQAAVRELYEETGIEDAQFLPGFLRQIDYYFRSPKHGVIHKTVVFFLAQTQTIRIKLSDEHVAYSFDAFDPAMKKLSYASARDVLRAARDFLAQASL